MRFILIMISILLTFTAFAGDKLSGHIGIGAGYVSSDDNMIPSHNSKDQNKNNFSDTLLIITGEARYAVSDRVTLHAGIPMEAFDPSFQAGVTTSFGSSNIDVSAVYIPAKVWKDPYVSYRDDTYDNIAGLSVKYTGIASSGFFAEMKVLSHSVDDDLAEKAHNSLGRDGTETDYKLGYTFKKQSATVDLYLHGTEDDRDGRAESSSAFGEGIVLKIITPSRDRFFIGAESMYREFDGANPYFGSTRNDTALKVFTGYTFNDVFGLKNKYLTLSGFYGKSVSNISFFDSESTGIIVITGIKF